MSNTMILFLIVLFVVAVILAIKLLLKIRDRPKAPTPEPSIKYAPVSRLQKEPEPELGPVFPVHTSETVLRFDNDRLSRKKKERLQTPKPKLTVKPKPMMEQITEEPVVAKKQTTPNHGDPFLPIDLDDEHDNALGISIPDLFPVTDDADTATRDAKTREAEPDVDIWKETAYQGKSEDSGGGGAGGSWTEDKDLTPTYDVIASASAEYVPDDPHSDWGSSSNDSSNESSSTSVDSSSSSDYSSSDSSSSYDSGSSSDSSSGSSDW